MITEGAVEAEAEKQRTSYLVVEDNRFVARALRRFFGRHGRVEVAHDLHSAREVLEWSGDLRALILDVQLPDGSGLDLLAELRRHGHRTPALVLSAFGDDDVLRRAQLLHALFLPKPAPDRHLQAFLDWAENQEPARRLLAEVAELAEEAALTPREAEVVTCAARGVVRGDIHTHLGVEPSTVATLVKRLLRKTGHAHVSEVVAELHRRVFGA